MISKTKQTLFLLPNPTTSSTENHELCQQTSLTFARRRFKAALIILDRSSSLLWSSLPESAAQYTLIVSMLCRSSSILRQEMKKNQHSNAGNNCNTDCQSQQVAPKVGGLAITAALFIAQLVLGWVTVFGRVYHLGMQSSQLGQLILASLQGR